MSPDQPDNDFWGRVFVVVAALVLVLRPAVRMIWGV